MPAFERLLSTSTCSDARSDARPDEFFIDGDLAKILRVLGTLTAWPQQVRRIPRDLRLDGGRLYP